MGKTNNRLKNIPIIKMNSYEKCTPNDEFNVEH